jgi:hypothetical protein
VHTLTDQHFFPLMNKAPFSSISRAVPHATPSLWPGHPISQSASISSGERTRNLRGHYL